MSITQNPIAVKNGILTVNGKAYTFLAGFKHSGEFFHLMAAGRVPLKADDLGEHWKVVRGGENVYVAFHCRFFSYHLLSPEETEPPEGWPRLKTVDEYAFVAPNEKAARAVMQLVFKQHMPHLTQAALDRLAKKSRPRYDEKSYEAGHKEKGEHPTALLLSAYDVRSVTGKAKEASNE